MQDWGSSLVLAQALGPQARCLVDLGHHLPNTNVELVVARLISNPTVVLIPGLGMIARGKTKSESRVTAEFYAAAVGVMRGAEAVSTYTALPRQEAFDIEYWLLEEAKLKRMPPEKEPSWPRSI